MDVRAPGYRAQSTRDPLKALRHDPLKAEFGDKSSGNMKYVGDGEGIWEEVSRASSPLPRAVETKQRRGEVRKKEGQAWGWIMSKGESSFT